MRSRDTISGIEARWLAIDAQGLARARPRGPITRRHVRSAIEAVGTIQLDAINVVERTQFLVPYSRLGPYDVAGLHRMTGPDGELFEYWGHAASLLPVTHEPLFRWRMAVAGNESAVYQARREAWQTAHADYIASVLREIHDRGPLPASQLTDPRRRDGEWWDRRSFGRQALELLFARGEVAAWRTANFERVYDLPERVIPEAVRSQPTPPTDDAHRQLILLAAKSLGVATARDLASYYFMKPKVVSARVAELVEVGALAQVEVEGWRDPAYALPTARVSRPRREHATLLSPFDSLIWDRARTLRLFGFDYRIEVYVPAPKRKFGYYVLPLLVGDDLVARFDLKADRKASALLVRGAFLERGVDGAPVASAAVTELRALQSWLRLDDLVIDGRGRGNLAPALRRAART